MDADRDMPKILAVDDEVYIRRFIEFTLKKGGYEMLMATNGKEAAEVATRQFPSHIIMDVLMPQRDGIEVLKLLKQIEATASIPVIYSLKKGERKREAVKNHRTP
ncbi:MAG: Alkaline phosphatase synthesis transcriptional regulatory protein PhoP [Verrucomicrobia subdivision 3 bacterium]|nr:Alkaline phosphatase synthesis transcriptional regulatory protein PhoP [Limisphaerales bacterium]MCS1417580.1 Alkaline phosphatase synthesis transcriptional regulatory protein PhoP [Limisphaerales bacterium]